MLIAFIILAIIGFCISLYTYITEQKIRRDPDFKAACDLSERISCTKPMKSPYANIFFFSNALVGMGYYVLIAILALFDALPLLLIASIASCIVSCILAYLLYVKIQSLCLLCTSLYIINIIILVLATMKFYA